MIGVNDLLTTPKIIPTSDKVVSQKKNKIISEINSILNLSASDIDQPMFYDRDLLVLTEVDQYLNLETLGQLSDQQSQELDNIKLLFSQYKDKIIFYQHEIVKIIKSKNEKFAKLIREKKPFDQPKVYDCYLNYLQEVLSELFNNRVEIMRNRCKVNMEILNFCSKHRDLPFKNYSYFFYIYRYMSNKSKQFACTTFGKIKDAVRFCSPC
ncbi:hypothetical protein AB837_00532 [bacterium AB1]|nr:hypothetical protein AB837_00532 [bacterium AB1]